MQAIDKAAPAMTITLGGTERPFYYTVRSFSRVKAILGKKASELDITDPDHVGVLVWAGLIEGDPSLGLHSPIDARKDEPGVASKDIIKAIDDIQGMIRWEEMSGILETVSKAVTKSQSEPKKK